MTDFIVGEEVVQMNIKNLSRDIVLKVLDNMWISGNKIADDARIMVPVKTGRLRDSIVVETPSLIGDSEIRCVISANVHYAVYVELGTWKMTARPYLKPALYANQQEFIDSMKEIL